MEKEEEFVEEVVDVPKEIEVEEVVEREVFQDVVETRKIPQVKAMYAYKGQGMKVEKGEVSGLPFVRFFSVFVSAILLISVTRTYLLRSGFVEDGCQSRHFFVNTDIRSYSKHLFQTTDI